MVVLIMLDSLVLNKVLSMISTDLIEIPTPALIEHVMWFESRLNMKATKTAQTWKNNSVV